MITQLALSNFQCYSKLALELHPHFNVFVGESNAGKTAILRALRLLFYNQPRGLYLVRKGASELSVECITDTGHTLKRTRGKKVNSYAVDDEVYKNFGVHVPEEVTRTLGIASSELLSDIYNAGFAGQLDGPFLLNITDSQKGKILTSLSDVSEVDQVLSEVRAERRKSKTTTDKLLQDLEEVEAQQSTFAWVPSAQAKVAKLETILVRVEETQRQIEQLKKLQDQYERCTEQLEQRRRVVTILANKLNLYSSLSLETIWERYSTLTTLLTNWRTAANTLSQLQKDRDVLASSTTTSSIHIDTATQLQEELSSLILLQIQWQKTQSEMELQTDSILEHGRLLSYVKKEQQKVIQGLGGICPTCAQPLGEDALAHLEEGHS